MYRVDGKQRVMHDGFFLRHGSNKIFVDDEIDGGTFCHSGKTHKNPACDDSQNGGAYWRFNDSSFCAACCRDKNNSDAKVLEVLIRRTKCPFGDSNSFKTKIPRELHCFNMSSEVVLQTGMGQTTVKTGTTKNEFWCSDGGLRVLSGPLMTEDGGDTCLMEDEATKWTNSKYQKGFGCGNQFFIGVNNMKLLSNGPSNDSNGHGRDIGKGKLKLKIDYDNTMNFTEEQGISLLGEPPNSHADVMIMLQDAPPVDNNSVFNHGYESRAFASRFCDDDNVADCGVKDSKSRWWFMKDDNGNTKDDICLTCCKPKDILKNFGSWDSRKVNHVDLTFIPSTGINP